MPSPPPHSSLRVVTQLLVTLYGLGALGLTLFTLYLCYWLEWRGPMRDLWEFIGGIQQQLQGHWDWQTLLEPYGGIHRLLLPKLLFYLDYRYGAGSNLLSLTVTLALHLGACVVLLRSLPQKDSFSRQEILLLGALVLWFFFSTTQLYNLIYNSDNQVVISNSLAIFAACVFVRQKIFMAHALVMLACLSHSSSLMLLPAFTVTLLLQAASKKIIGLQILFALALLLTYISGADPLEDPAQTVPLWQQIPHVVSNLISQLPGIVSYIGLHLSSPLSRLWPTGGIVLTYLSLAYVFALLWRIYQQQRHVSAAERFWLVLALYGFFIAVVTACGRQVYPGSALTDRYQTLVLTYWPALLLLLYTDLRHYRPMLLFTVPLLSLLILLPHQYTKAREMAWLSSRVTVAHTAATVGITDMDTVSATLSHPLLRDNNNLVARHNDFLRDYALGYFNDPGAEYFLNGQTPVLLDRAPAPGAECRGELLSLEKIVSEQADDSHHSWRLSGRSQVDGRAAATVLVVDGRGQVIGLGRDLRPKGEFRPLRWRPAASSQWLGFIRSTTPLQFPLSVMAYRPQQVCELFQVHGF